MVLVLCHTFPSLSIYLCNHKVDIFSRRYSRFSSVVTCLTCHLISYDKQLQTRHIYIYTALYCITCLGDTSIFFLFKYTIFQMYIDKASIYLSVWVESEWFWPVRSEVVVFHQTPLRSGKCTHPVISSMVCWKIPKQIVRGISLAINLGYFGDFPLPTHEIICFL